jgi:cobalt-zinc-cadmium efflux system protein
LLSADFTMHDHSHEGHHHGPQKLTNVNAAFIWGIVLNTAFVIIEVVIGLATHSLSLLSDAGHNLADVGSLALSLLAFRMMKVKANDQYTYGYRKTSILAALANAIILLISLGAIIYEAAWRLFRPQPLPGISIAIVAAIGIVINAVSAGLFSKNKEHDINVKSAYLHLLADAAISAGVSIAGLVIYYTGWFWLDAVVSIVIAIVILVSTWGLLKDSLRLSLEGVPSDIDLNKVKQAALSMEGVQDFYHVHVWALSSTENALTGHLVLRNQTSMEQVQRIKEDLKHRLQHQNITHITLETETAATKTAEQACQAATQPETAMHRH